MYRVTVTTDGREYPLHEPNDDKGILTLINPVVTQEMGKSDTFTFRIAPVHPNKDKIAALRSEIKVYDNADLIFCGRYAGGEKDFWNIGKISCEGELSYLVDSIQRPYDFVGNTVEFFRKCIQAHNSQVEERKRFEVGNMTIPDTAAEVQRADTECRNTLETIKAQLTERNGGFLRVRHSDGKKYLDCVSDYGGINGQIIRFGENLLDMKRYIKPAGIITALLPYGAEIESEDTEEKKRVDITAVNNGKDYVSDEDSVNEYGWIWGTQTFDDAAEPETLLSKAKAYLTESIALPETLDLKAADLNLIDVKVQRLTVGCWTTVESVPHGISKKFMLSKKTINLDNPGKDEIVLGRTIETFTGTASKNKLEISDHIQRIASSTSKEINRKIENATQLITGGKGGYVVLDVADPDTGEKTHPWRILVMDTPDKETAKSVWQLNKNGLGFSRTGINGPYDNAWTIDGNLIADFITAGTMLADRIRGGSLELGGIGIGKDGCIVVKDKNDNEIGRIDINGLDIKRRGAVGFKADGNTAQVGDFKVDDAYGRQILQSTDEVTGISGEPNEEGQLYFWAGYYSSRDYALIVNNLGETKAKELFLKFKQNEADAVSNKWPYNGQVVNLDANSFEKWSVSYMLMNLWAMHNYQGMQELDILQRIRDLEDNINNMS